MPNFFVAHPLRLSIEANPKQGHIQGRRKQVVEFRLKAIAQLVSEIARRMQIALKSVGNALQPLIHILGPINANDLFSLLKKQAALTGRETVIKKYKG
jgi:hypothetical protein